MLNKVKEMGSTISKKVVENKKQIAIVAGGAVVLGPYGVYVYKNIKGMETLIVKGAKGTYELTSFRGGGQMLDGGDWGVISNGIIDRELVMDAMIHSY